MNNADNEMLSLFIQEANEHVQTLDEDLVAMESGPHDSERLNRIFRAVHSMKGTAGFFGFNSIVGLAHSMESVMALVREGEMPESKTLLDLLFASTDKLRLMTADPERSSSIDASAEIAGFNRLLERQAPESPAELAPMLPAYLLRFEMDQDLVRRALSSDLHIFLLELRLHTDVEKQGQTLLPYFEELYSLGTIIATSTDIESVSGLEGGLRPDIVCSVLFATGMEDTLLMGAFDLPASQLTPVPVELLANWVKTQPKTVWASETPEAAPGNLDPSPSQPLARMGGERLTMVVAVEGAPDRPEAIEMAKPEPTRVFPTRTKTEETVRINVELLDNLMNLASSMVLGRNKLVRLAENESTGGAVDGLRAVVQEINAVTSEMQSTIMSARLHPLGNLFGKFTRIVRDLGQKLNKEIQLEILGDDVELDRTLLEGLSDPLTHLVRNCADHAIETPQERMALGKPSAGRIRLAAAHLSGRVQIEVRDDGRGLDPEKLKAKAIEKGLMSPEAAARLTHAEACKIIFTAGFSTAVEVSDVSGRGVGMDVVKTNIEKLGGHVELESELGRGTAVIIRLPLTLAIIPALVVSCGGQAFAMPQINLEEIVEPGEKCPLEFLGSARVIRLREELLPVLDLAEILGQSQAVPEVRYLLVLQLDHTRFGLLVDEISNTEEIVVKPLGRHLKAVPYYSGATLLGQGDIALILDPAALAQGRISSEMLESAAVSTLALPGAQDVASIERVLVFHDASPERFALHLTSITRVELIPSSRIERIGNRECLRQENGPTLQLIRPGHFLPVTPPAPYGEEVYVIVPRLVHHPVGIIASEIVDSADLDPASLDKKMFESPALFGASTLLERLTLVVDIYGLIRAAGFMDPLPPALPDAPNLASLRVLLAEDTAFFRQAVLRALQGVVATLDLAADGEEAWKMLQETEYDVLLTDIEMPRLDGFDLAARVRNAPRTQKLPIIAISARGSQAFIDRAAKVGIDIYETKFDRERIIAAVQKVMSSPR